MRKLLVILCMLALALVGCTAGSKIAEETGAPGHETETREQTDAAEASQSTAATEAPSTEEEIDMYTQITPEAAKKMMDEMPDAIILDVREASEYAEGHIPGARLLPLGTVEAEAETALPHKDAVLLVYCRSGRRSKMAAEILAALGYSAVYEFGGILDWPYESVKE